MTLAEMIVLREAEGFRICQEGRVLRPSEQGVSFAERVEGCAVSWIRSGDVLLDDAERWVHMQRSKNEPTTAA